MRSIKDLLILLDEEIDGKHFTGGLCVLMTELHDHDIISSEEWHELSAYLKDNNPDAINLENKENRNVNESVYWWLFGAKEPRHRYLQYLINQLP